MAKLFLFVDCQKNGVTSANIIFLRLCLKGIYNLYMFCLGYMLFIIDYVLFPSMLKFYVCVIA